LFGRRLSVSYRSVSLGRGIVFVIVATSQSLHSVSRSIVSPAKEDRKVSRAATLPFFIIFKHVSLHSLSQLFLSLSLFS